MDAVRTDRIGAKHQGPTYRLLVVPRSEAPVAWMFESYLLYEYYFAMAQLVFAMLGMGATLRVKDFIEVVRYPQGFGLGLFCVVIASPVLALAVAHLFELEPGIATGLILVSAVPGGTMSNILTYFARGNIPLSISLTGTATVACLVTTPLMLRLFGGIEDRPDFEMPIFRMATEIVAFLLIPLAAGMVFGTRYDDQRERFTKICIRLSLSVIVVMVVGSSGAGRIDAGAYGAPAILAIFAFGAGIFVVAMLGSRLMRLSARDGVTVGIESAYRNTSLAILIKASLFPAIPGVPDVFADQVFFVALLYGGFALLVVLPPLFLHRRRAEPLD